MLLLLLSCARPTSHLEELPPRCGDGVVDLDEACDAGAANADAADACRLACVLPACGDGILDAGEACDDGRLDGGDGCDGTCAVETGTLEVEPNDSVAEATVLTDGVGLAHGGLSGSDTDCWSFPVERCGAVTVSEVAPCAAALGMALYAPSGSLLAVGAPGEDGCAHLDPADQPGARWVEEGSWTVCVGPLAGAAPSYALDIETGASTGLLAAADLDGDGEADSCDLDRDGDGVADDIDTCPDVSNGPDTMLSLSEEGFVRTWLGAGPFTGDASTDGCRPAEEARVGEDADVAPAIGEPAGESTWSSHLLTADYFDLNTEFGSVAAPREAYTAVWLQSDASREATLAVGADDGVYAWWNGELVLDVSGCQGLSYDQFQAPVEIAAGWNLLLLKVRDQGGAWSVSARLLDVDGVGITDLAPGLDPEGAWLPDQSDSDGDGVGDACE